MKQSKRIWLSSKHIPKANELLERTGIESCSQLFSIFLVNFGDELIKRLQGEDLENEQGNKLIEQTKANPELAGGVKSVPQLSRLA